MPVRSVNKLVFLYVNTIMLNLIVNCLITAIALYLKKDTLRFLVRMAIVCLCSSIQAQEAELHRIYFKPGEQLTGNYAEVKENNLPIKGARTLYQSSDQAIWIGTEGDGLICYTGNAIKHYRFDPKDKASLPGNRIDEIWEESPRILWITTNDRIAKLDRLSGRISRFEAFTHFVRKTHTGTLYTSVIGKGLYRIDTIARELHRVSEQRILNEKGVLYPGETMTSIDRLQTDKKGVLWAVGRTQALEGLFRFNEQTRDWVHCAPGAYYYPFLNVRVYKKAGSLMVTPVTLFIDNSDRIWFGGWGVGLFCYNIKSGQWQQYYFYKNTKGILDDNNVLDIYPLSEDELWIAGVDKGFIFNHQRKAVYQYTYQEDRGNVHPFQKGSQYALLDHCGNRWIAGGQGVFKYNPAQNRFFDAKAGARAIFKNQRVTAFNQLGPEHYLLGTRYVDAQAFDFKSEIYEIKKGKMLRHFSINKYMSNIPLSQFVPAGNNEFYVCSQKLYKLNLKSGSLQTIPVKIKNEAAYKHEDYYDNILWNDSILFSCRRTTANAGLVKVNLKRGETRLYKTASVHLSPRSPQDNEVVGLTKDGYNRIWCSTAGGIDIFYPDKEVFEHYSSVEGDTTSLLGTSAPRICKAPDGTFYIASQSGVCATKTVPGTRAIFTPIAYLDCEWIVTDKANMLWVGTPEGVARINPTNNTYKIFGTNDGFYWDTDRKPLLMPDGRFMMHDGAIIDPTAIAQNTFKPAPRISDFLVAGQPFSLDTTIGFKQHIRLKNDQNFFSIGYTCNNYILEEDNTYRYKLEGIDHKWIEAGTRTMAFYTALPPGSYHFYLRAANNDGIWGEPKKLLTITIVPAWYQTWWFKTAIALLITVTAYAFYHQRLMQERVKHLADKRAAELKQREAELKQITTEFEKQLAETEMAALRSQMNPHFIFNVLNSINRFILSNDKNTASDYLVEFSRLIRLTLENSKAAKVPLQNDLEALRIYIEMEKLRFGNKFTFSMETEENIDPQYLHIPPLLVQPYVENAIWHGLMQRDTPGHLLVQVTQPEENVLKVVVQDNGIGRARAQEIKSKSATVHKSYGLQITSDRIKIVNKLHGIKATVTVEDLHDAVQQPKGTKVTLLIPV